MNPDPLAQNPARTLALARTAFLPGCGLPAAWAGQAQWRVLDTRFGGGLRFLATWAAWRADPQRCRMLHFVALEASPVAPHDLLRAAQQHSELLPLAHAIGEEDNDAEDEDDDAPASRRAPNKKASAKKASPRTKSARKTTSRR